MHRRHTLGRPALLAALTLALLAPALAPGSLADCWGCSKNECTFGFKTGGFLCQDFVGECSLISRLTGGCAAKACEILEPCAEGKRPATPIVVPQPADGQDDGGSKVKGSTGPALPADDGAVETERASTPR